MQLVGGRTSAWFGELRMGEVKECSLVLKWERGPVPDGLGLFKGIRVSKDHL